MIQLTQEQWNSIPNDYKGQWTESLKSCWQPDLPENYIDKRTVMSGCISNEIGSLLTESIHFEIVNSQL